MMYATGGAASTNVEVGTNFIAVSIFPATVLSDRKTIWGPTVVVASNTRSGTT